MPRRLARLALLLATMTPALLTVALDAAAEPGSTSSLSWVVLPGAEACGGAAALAHAVEERLGRHALVSPAEADLSIEGSAARTGTPPSLHAVLVLRNTAGAVLGTRELQSAQDDCVELRADVALAVALLIDPEAALTHAEPRPHPADAPPAPAAPSWPWTAEPWADVVFGGGFLPSASVGATMGVTVAPPHFWPVELYGGVWGNQGVPSQAGTSTRFTASFAGLSLCPLHAGALSSLRLRLDLCGGGLLGVVGSVGSGFVRATSSSEPTLGFAVDGHVAIPLAGPVAARLGGTLSVAVIWNNYVYTDSAGTQSDFAPGPLAAAADVGLAVQVP